MSEISLGKKLKDRVSGMEGIATARIEYLNGCVQWAIHPEWTKDFQKNESFWIDEKQIEVLGEGLADIKQEATGGSMPRPSGGMTT